MLMRFAFNKWFEVHQLQCLARSWRYKLNMAAARQETRRRRRRRRSLCHLLDTDYFPPQARVILSFFAQMRKFD